jgi:hypothetical protein
MTFASVRLRSTAFGPRKTAGHLMPGHRPVASSIFALMTRKPFCLRAAGNSAALICGTGIGSLKRTIGPAYRRRAADVEPATCALVNVYLGIEPTPHEPRPKLDGFRTRGVPMSRSALSPSEGRFFGLDALEWSVTLVGSGLLGLAAWLM